MVPLGGLHGPRSRTTHAGAWSLPSPGRFLDVVALEEGLVNPEVRARSSAAVRELLERLHSNSLFEEIEGALERHHEVAHMRPLSGGLSDIWVIDLVYRTAVGWKVVDFKTDHFSRESEAVGSAGAYRPQLERFRHAVRALLGNESEGRFWFPDCSRSVRVLCA